MKNLDLEFLHLELNRTTEWIKFSDQKSGFLSVYYSVILGLLISHKASIPLYIFSHNGLVLACYILVLSANIILLLSGIFWLFVSIFPRLTNLTTDKSVFYFGHVADLKFIDYLKDLKKLSVPDIKEQIIEQIHANSVIANRKMKNIQKTTKCLFMLVFMSIALISF
jgi:hypothetical protein